tara:strand:- start:570 stop:854 length:285 start_codon:yes stop_codon:yes gene_type:complete
MNREQRRSAAKKAKKGENSELEEKMALFSELSDECLTCAKPFDKRDKAMVQSWNVVIREQEGKVNLYCPECWDKAVNLLKGFKKHLEEKSQDDE